MERGGSGETDVSGDEGAGREDESPDPLEVGAHGSEGTETVCESFEEEMGAMGAADGSEGGSAV